ncbi:MAG: glycosyltransferase [Eggerthellaceae bacterium]|nr:glycosyltransferase [Eggerthellaceae bacterium]
MTAIEASNPKVSVLVPVYNVEKYLGQCMDALCAQSLHEIEIICVNDGSTDNSLSLLQDYAARDSRIRIIDKPNSGYGASLNKAIELASGEYIGIVESDDFPSRKMFEALYGVATRHGCDLAKSNFFQRRGRRDFPIANLRGFPYKKPFDPKELPAVICTVPSIWSGLYSRRMLEDSNIRFRETPGASFQDASFGLKAWFAAQSCVLLRRPLLHYRIDNPGSSVKTSDKVFVVCDELAESEAFLRALPQRCESFIPWFHVDKWGKYRWNYERITAAEHLGFAQRMFAEYSVAQEAGELKAECFSPKDWEGLTLLLEKGAEAFAVAHPEVF